MALNLAHKSALAGLNSGCTTVARQMRIDEIQLSDDFSSLFPVNPSVLNQIVERIKKYGFDSSQPLHIWKENRALLDGHFSRFYRRFYFCRRFFRYRSCLFDFAGTRAEYFGKMSSRFPFRPVIRFFTVRSPSIF